MQKSVADEFLNFDLSMVEEFPKSVADELVNLVKYKVEAISLIFAPGIDPTPFLIKAFEKFHIKCYILAFNKDVGEDGDSEAIVDILDRILGMDKPGGILFVVASHDLHQYPNLGRILKHYIHEHLRVVFIGNKDWVQ